jgi:hypothetical protein
MTGFEEKVKDFLMRKGVLRDLWEKSVKKEKAEEECSREENTFEGSRIYFEEGIEDFMYEWVRKIENKEAVELLEEALGDMDITDLANDIIVELNLRVEE